MKVVQAVVRNSVTSVGLMLRRRVLRWALSRRSPNAHPRFAVLPGDTVSEEVLVAGLYEETLLDALFDTLLADRREVFAASTALDVGANIGNHSLFFARRFAAVHAFEPNPVALALLRCNVELAGASHLIVHAVGLGDQDGLFTFAQNDSDNLGGSGFRFAGVAGGREVACEIRRGDSLLSPQTLCHPLALVKIDVEGAELAVLRGLEGTLRRERPVVVFESNRAHGPHGGAAVIDTLRSLGYRDFCAVEEIGANRSRAARLVGRLLHGERVAVAPLETLQDRPYQMLVALP